MASNIGCLWSSSSETCALLGTGGPAGVPPYIVTSKNVTWREERVLWAQGTQAKSVLMVSRWLFSLYSLLSAIALLKDQEPGAFIIRDSHSFRGAYGLAMKVSSPPPTISQQGKKGRAVSSPSWGRGWGFLLSSDRWVLNRVLIQQGWALRSPGRLSGGFGDSRPLGLGVCVRGVSRMDGRKGSEW